jgi:hypothetical protein
MPFFATVWHIAWKTMGVAGGLEHQVVRAVGGHVVDQRVLLGADIPGAERLDEAAVEVWPRGQAVRRDLQPVVAQHHRGEQADRPGAEHRGPAGVPHLEPPLDLMRLHDAFLDDAERFEQDGDVAQRGRDADQVARLLDVPLGEEAVHPADAVLEVAVVGGHVGRVDVVVQAGAGAAYPGHHMVAGGELGDRRPGLLDDTEALVAEDQVVVPVRGGAVLGGVNLPVGAVQPDAQDPHEDAAAVRDIGQRRVRDVGEVRAADLAGAAPARHSLVPRRSVMSSRWPSLPEPAGRAPRHGPVSWRRRRSCSPTGRSSATSMRRPVRCASSAGSRATRAARTTWCLRTPTWTSTAA